MQIKNIIFDLGGVFLTIDYKKTEHAFLDLRAHNFPELYTQQHASQLFELLETGNISPANFFIALRKAANFHATDEEIANAWSAMLGSFPNERLKWLDEIRQRYNIYLFSNTNEIHYSRFNEKFYKETGIEKFEDYFIKAFYSHKIHLRKPHVESYLKILREENLHPAETLFIDDTYPNIEGAKKAGLQTVYLKHPMTVLELDL